MDQQHQPITGVIIAGGKSSRMGSDKGLIDYNGKLLAQYSIDLLGTFCPELFISANNDEYLQFGLPLIADEIPDCGPIGGIYSALKASKTDYILALACDMPFVSVATIRLLLNTIEGFDCVVPILGNRLEPLCAVYSKSLINKIEVHMRLNDLSMSNMIVNSNHRIVDFNNDVNDFMNFNTPDDMMNFLFAPRL